MKESTIGEINLLSKKSRTTRIEDDEDEEGQNEKREGMRGETLLKGSKNRIYFENLVFKNIWFKVLSYFTTIFFIIHVNLFWHWLL